MSYASAGSCHARNTLHMACASMMQSMWQRHMIMLCDYAYVWHAFNSLLTSWQCLHLSIHGMSIARDATQPHHAFLLNDML